MQGTPQAGLELLTFMAISAYRIMPSMSRLNSALMQMRTFAHVLEAMELGAAVNTSEKPNNAATTVLVAQVDIHVKDSRWGTRPLNNRY